MASSCAARRASARPALLIVFAISLLSLIGAAPRARAAIHDVAFLSSTPDPQTSVPVFNNMSVPFLPAMFGTIPAQTLVAPIVFIYPLTCSPFSFLSSPLSVPVAGSFALISGSGCAIDELALGTQAAGAIGTLFATSPTPLFDDGAWILAPTVGTFSIPFIIIDKVLGEKLSSGLDTKPTELFNATLTLLGSGPIVSTDKAALAAMYGAMSINGTQPWNFGFYGQGSTGENPDKSGGLLPWTQLLTNYSAFDPCITRAFGVWCADGRIVQITCSNCGIRGALAADAMLPLTALQHLSLESNAISGTLPCALGSLTSLRFLRLSVNKITGDFGACFNSLSRLVGLVMSDLKLTSVPPLLGTFTSLRRLELQNNRITSLPNLSALVGMLTLDVANNLIQQTVMPSFKSMSKIVTLDIHNNQFSGTFAASAFDGLSELISIHVGSNAISGSLPLLNGCSALVSVNFGLNQFTGITPSEWSGVDVNNNNNANLPSLTTVILSHNQLTSPVLLAGSLIYLLLADVSYNRITLVKKTTAGALVSTDLGDFLQASFSRNIRQINLANNRLNGTWQFGYFGFFDSITVFSVADNQLSGPLPHDLWKSNPTNTLQTLDLSGNLWTGKLPPGIPQTSLLSVSVAKCPRLQSQEVAVPTFLMPSSSLILDASAQFSCPRLVASDPASTYQFFIDPAYYGYASCKCQRGFTSGGAPPNCAPFPIEVPVTAITGVVSDGNSSGRLRQGADSRFYIRPAGAQFAVINVQVEIFASSSSQTQVSLYNGRSLAGQPLFFYSTLGASATNQTLSTVQRVSVFGVEAVLHYVSDADGGPQFRVAYTTSNECPDGTIPDEDALQCVPRTAANVADLSAGARDAFLVLSVCALCVCAFLFVYTQSYRGDPVFAAATPNTLLVLLVGVTLIGVAVAVMTRDQTATLCALQVWLFNAGFALAFGTVFVKTVRLYLIFNNDSLQQVIITERHLGAAVLCILAVDAAIIAAWQVVSPFSVALYPAGACTSLHGTRFATALIVLKGALLVGASVLNYITRTLPVKFSESALLAAVSYGAALLALVWVGVVVGLGAQIDPSSRTTISAALALAGAVVTLAITFAPKVRKILANKPEMDANEMRDARDSMLAASTAAVKATRSQRAGTLSGDGNVAALSLDQLRDIYRREWTVERDKQQKEYDLQVRKVRTLEDQLERGRERVVEMFAGLIDADMELAATMAGDTPEAMLRLESVAALSLSRPRGESTGGDSALRRSVSRFGGGGGGSSFSSTRDRTSSFKSPSSVSGIELSHATLAEASSASSSASLLSSHAPLPPPPAYGAHDVPSAQTSTPVVIESVALDVDTAKDDEGERHGTPMPTMLAAVATTDDDNGLLPGGDDRS